MPVAAEHDVQLRNPGQRLGEPEKQEKHPPIRGDRTLFQPRGQAGFRNQQAWHQQLPQFHRQGTEVTLDLAGEVAGGWNGISQRREDPVVRSDGV